MGFKWKRKGRKVIITCDECGETFALTEYDVHGGVSRNFHGLYGKIAECPHTGAKRFVKKTTYLLQRLREVIPILDNNLISK